MPLELTPERGLLFRITHVRNLRWLLANGLPSVNSGIRDPNFVEIGNPDLISKRASRAVPISPDGTLADYVPFYFTPKSPMLYNIKTGWKGMMHRSNAEIIVLISSVHLMRQSCVNMLFTDRHAYIATARWSNNPADLATMIDWDILRRYDFASGDNYPDKMDRYQAEALAHQHVPIVSLIGIGCASDDGRPQIEAMVSDANVNIPVRARPGWYFW